MLRGIPLIVIIIAQGCCMETRETVERMVMVRTTGSDLQPAATGYIYKKDGHGPERVIEMGEQEVMEQLSKFYKQPEAFAAPIPVAAGPFYAKEEDESKAASYIKPVVEKSEEDDHVDGLANDNYDKIYDEYAASFGKYNDDFADYLKDLGYFKDGIYHEHGGGEDGASEGHHSHGEKGGKGYASGHHYGKGGAGDYHTEKYATFSVSRKGGHKKDYDEGDAYGKDHAEGHGYKGGDHGHKVAHSKGEEVDGFHKVFNKDEFKKDHDFYDGEKHEGSFHKHNEGHSHHGSDAGGHKKGGEHESGGDERSFGKSGHHDEESGDEKESGHSLEGKSESAHYNHGNFGTDGGKYDGKSYGYEIKH